MKKTKEFLISNDLLFAVLDNTPFGIIALTKEGKIQWINVQSLIFLGIKKTVKEVINNPILEILQQHIELHDLVKKKLLKKGKPFDLEGSYFNSRYLTFRGRIIKEGMILTIADITTIKISEFLSLNSMLEGQEMERKRLAREIHDGIGPLLSTLKMILANIEGDINNRDINHGDKFIKSYELIDEVSNDLRSISHNLLPKVLLDFGLIEALESLSEKIQTTKNVDMAFMYTGSKKRFDQVLELGIYRVCQELISNTIKHAKARKISLQLVNLGNILRLIYEDDGIGFLPTKNAQGLGILNIENRIKAFGGEVNIDSLPGKGMTASIEIELNLKSDGTN